MGRASSLGVLLACSLFAQLLPCSTLSSSLSHSHYSLEHSYQGPDGSIRTGSQAPERVRQGGRAAFADATAAATAKLGGFDRYDVRMEDLAFVGAMPLPMTFPLTAPTISGVTAPGPSGVGAGQGWVWAVGADGPQLVRSNGTALSAYSLYGPALASLKSKRTGAEALAGWAGAAGQPSLAKEWPRMQLGQARKTYRAGGGAGLRSEEQVRAGVRLLLSPSTSTPSSLRGEMVAKLRGLSGRFELAKGHAPVNLLLRHHSAQPQPLQPDSEPDLMDDSDEEDGGEEGARECGGQWHAGAEAMGPLVQPTSDSWLEEHNRADRSLLPHVASLLACAAEGGDEEEEGGEGPGGEKSAFEAQRRPKVSLGEYCERMLKYGACSPGCLAVAVIYVDRFLARGGPLRVTGLNVHRLLLGAALLATKQWDDAHYNNAFWAKVGGVSTEELNGLERTLLAGMGWKLHVDKPQFDRYRAALSHWPATAEAGADRLRDGPAGALRGSMVMEAAERGLAASKGRAAGVRLKREEPDQAPAGAEQPAAAAAAAVSPAIAA